MEYGWECDVSRVKEEIRMPERNETEILRLDFTPLDRYSFIKKKQVQNCLAPFFFYINFHRFKNVGYCCDIHDL